MNNEVAKLKEILKHQLPGAVAHEKMMPESRKTYSTHVTNKTKKSSILISLFLKHGEYHTILFKRPDYDGTHAGQVCFPGGKYEKSDRDFEYTAIREAHEEIGIEENTVEILGQLTPLHIPVSDYIVHPFVAFLKCEPIYKPDPLEVQEIIISPLKEFTNNDNIKSKIMTYKGQNFDVPYYAIKNFFIWGATAMIISEWLEVLNRINFPHTSLYSAGSVQ